MTVKVSHPEPREIAVAGPMTEATAKPAGSSSADTCSALADGLCQLHGDVPSSVLKAAGRLLSTAPLHEVTLRDVAKAAGTTTAQLQQVFDSMHDLAAAVLDYERSTMALIQSRIRAAGGQPLDQVVRAFQLVGEALANDVVMRAGVRLAKESKQAFPERRLEPTLTWDAFLEDLLVRARAQGLLQPEADVTSEVRASLSEALDVRDQLVAGQDWSGAAAQLEAVGRRHVTAISLRHREAAESEQGR